MNIIGTWSLPTDKPTVAVLKGAMLSWKVIPMSMVDEVLPESL